MEIRSCGLNNGTIKTKKSSTVSCGAYMLALPIFTASRPATIVGVHVLNFCVRDGERCERCLRQIKRAERGAAVALQGAAPASDAQGGYRKRKQVDPHDNQYVKKENPDISVEVFVLALPIFTASRPATIVGVHVLNFCVRDGNRWTHMTINTNLCGWVSPIFVYVKSFPASNRLVTHTGFEPMLTA